MYDDAIRFHCPELHLQLVDAAVAEAVGGGGGGGGGEGGGGVRVLDFGEGSFMAELEGTLSQLQVASVGHRSVLSVVPDAAAGGGGGGGEGIEDRVIIEDESTKASDEVPLTTQPYKYDL